MIWKQFIITSISIVEVIMIYRTSKKNQDKKKLLKEFIEQNPLNLESEILEKLDGFRKLRNRVHLEVKFEDDDTDWFMFNEEEYKDIKLLLYKMLTSEKMFNKDYHNKVEFLK